MPLPRQEQETLPRVPAPEAMDNETFRKHYNARHLKDAKLAGPLPEGMAWDRLHEMWRAFHQRCHELGLPGQFDHEHLGSWE